MKLSQFIPALSEKPLSDPSHPAVLGTPKVETPPDALTLAGGAVAVAAGAAARVELFNAESDEDAEGVFGPRPKDPELPPPALHLRDDAGAAWLKYAVEAHAKASATATFPFVAAEGTGTFAITLADYRLHPPARALKDALQVDLKNALRVPTRASDLALLKKGDALSLHARLKLGATVSVSWSDALSANLGRLADVFPPGRLLTLNTTPGVKLTGTVSVTDEFAVVFTSLGKQRLRVDVRKANARGASAGPKLGVAVTPDGLLAFVDALLEGSDTKAVTRLCRAAEGTPLTADLLAVARKVLARLGVDEKLDTPSVQALWVKLKTALTDLARIKLEATFAYEYARLTKESTLLSLKLSLQEAQAHHAALLSGQLDELMTLHPDWVDRFFRERTATFSHAWGFGVSFGPWTLIDSKDRKQLQCVTQHTSPDRLHGPRRYAYLGQRSYEGTLFGRQVKWGGELRADMARFTTSPSAKDLTFGLLLQLTRVAGATSDDLLSALDEAQVWRVFDDTEQARVLADIRALAGKKEVELRLALKLDHDDLLALLPSMVLRTPEPLARALARAMPWDRSTVRANAAVRQGAYRELWKRYLDDKATDWTPRSARNEAALLVDRDPVLRGDARQNTLHERDGKPGSFEHVLAVNSPSSLGNLGNRPYAKLHDDWVQFSRAAGLLLTTHTLDRPVPPRPEQFELAEVFEDFEELFSNAFTLKALGAWLLELAAEKSLQGAVGRTLTVTVKGGDAQRVFGTPAGT